LFLSNESFDDNTNTIMQTLSMPTTKEIPHCVKTISHVWVFTHKKLGFCAFELGGTPIKPNPMGCWGIIILDHVALM
jgi:hypothetical protein